MSYPRSILHIFLLAIVVVTVAACSTVGDSKVDWGSTGVERVAGQAVVFAKIDRIKEGKAKGMGWLSQATAIVLPEDGNRAMTVPLDAQGWLFMSLKPGSYKLLSLHYTELDGRSVTLQINLCFPVEPGDNEVYIGHIGFATGGQRYVLGVKDAEEAAVEEFGKRYPVSKAQPVKRLLKREPKLGYYTRMLDACAKEWGLDCSRELQGLEPVHPPITRGLHGATFTAIDGLQPTMRWKPVGDPGVTYDIAIWEAATCPVALGETYVPGTLAAYEENLAKPEFALKAALKPKTKYYWSVRMRRGDTVSSWSRAGHFVFLLVAWSSGSGEWFAFETP